LVHVPNQGQQAYIYQVADPSLKYPYKEWVQIDVYLDFSQTSGYAKVWQNGVLVSHARVEGGQYTLAQAHFGLYAAAAVPSGTVYNDKLSIREVVDEQAALDILGY